MFLTEENVCHYLLEKELISNESVVDGHFMAITTKTRNTLFKVLSGPRKLFIKQASHSDKASIHILTREANAYIFIHSHPDYSSLAASLPGLVHFDEDRNILTIEYLPDATDLHTLVMHARQFSPQLASTSGKVLGSYHFPVHPSYNTNAFPRLLPWALQLVSHRASDIFPGNEPAARLIASIQENERFKHLLQELKQEWEYTSLIHGDVKWINFMVDQPSRLLLIDWELADIGDPCWDLGGMFQSWLSAWIFGFSNKDPESYQLPENMRAFDIEEMQPSIRCLWEGYATERRLNPKEQERVLTKSIRYAAARLVQTSIEGVVYDPHLRPNYLRSLQVAFNILNDPALALETLMGLTV